MAEDGHHRRDHRTNERTVRGEDDVQEEMKETEQAREIQWQEQEKATIVRTEEVQPTEGLEQGVPLGTAGNAAINES